MAKSSMPDGVKTVIYWALGLGILAFIALILLILFGNLSGNTGFAVNSQGYNDTQSVINNFTQSQTNMAKQLPTVGIILGVALLLVILIGVLVFAIKKLMGAAGETGGASSNFG